MQKGKEFSTDWPIAPMGDQPQAIAKLVENIQAGVNEQVLLGVTGSGKTFTMANVIARLQRPALVMAPNKTLAAQLFQEFKELFPNNAVEYFISYYDYYQPEAYLPSTDTYISKDAAINQDIDAMRHSATRALFERDDVIIVSSVSCIYGLGDPETYLQAMVRLDVGQTMARDDFLMQLVSIQYSRNDVSLERGRFRVRGDIVEVVPASMKDRGIRVVFWGNQIESLAVIDALTGKKLEALDYAAFYPCSHHVMDREERDQILENIGADLQSEVGKLRLMGLHVEAARLEERTLHDIEMMREVGYCQGIENYSRYFENRAIGQPPPTLLDYFPEDYLLFIDESHVTIPQIGGMYRGDRVRKETLVNHGFRMASALDNRPLNFDEFKSRIGQVVYVSATPGPYELAQVGSSVVEQLIRPTGLVDPDVTIRPATHQVDDLLEEIRKTTGLGGRVLVTTLTKRMSEEITNYFLDLGVKVKYLHSDIDSLERVEILRDLRLGVFDVLVGINLLREGLDLPEVQLVAVLDADKEGFLRSRTSLIQTVGRAARNAKGRVLLYADRITGSIQACMEETARRREVQMAYNHTNGIVPQTVIKSIPEKLRTVYNLTDLDGEEELLKRALELVGDKKLLLNPRKFEKYISKLMKEMQKASAALDFEKAATLRDQIHLLKDWVMKQGSSDAV